MNPEIFAFGFVMGAVSGLAGYGASYLFEKSRHQHKIGLGIGFAIFILVGFFMFNKVLELQRERAKVEALRIKCGDSAREGSKE